MLTIEEWMENRMGALLFDKHLGVVVGVVAVAVVVWCFLKMG